MTKPTVNHAIFANNSAEEGGAILNEADGGTNHLALDQVYFLDNSAAIPGGSGPGGAIYNGSYADGNLEATNNLTLTNAVFVGNFGDEGSAIYNSSGQNGTINTLLTNVSLAGNLAHTSSTLFNAHRIKWCITIKNSIFWNNEDSSGVGTAASSIYNDPTATATIRYSLVQGCNPSGAWVASCGTDGGNNLADADPLFVETPNPAPPPMPTAICAYWRVPPSLMQGTTTPSPPPSIWMATSVFWARP
ncbi:MAG: hypothetical protein IPL28_08540 [Chloroflexi bacterium]|nr:hypothetical protein [Chloroflexota bacterium]